jgi:dTMP kinase
MGYGPAMGFFISFEGGEGGGKSTQAELLARALNAKGHPILTTREPGGTEIGKKIREILLSGKNQHLDPATELLLYAAIGPTRPRIDPTGLSGK